MRLMFDLQVATLIDLAVCCVEGILSVFRFAALMEEDTLSIVHAHACVIITTCITTLVRRNNYIGIITCFAVLICIVCEDLYRRSVCCLLLVACCLLFVVVIVLPDESLPTFVRYPS